MTGEAMVLDETIHQATRLRIMSMLVGQPDSDRLAYGFIREALDLTGGNLTTHLRKLEAAGYLAITKEFHNSKPRTWVNATRRDTKRSPPTRPTWRKPSTGARHPERHRSAIRSRRAAATGRLAYRTAETYGLDFLTAGTTKARVRVICPRHRSRADIHGESACGDAETNYHQRSTKNPSPCSNATPRMVPDEVQARFTANRLWEARPGMAWEPITGLGDDWPELASPELPPLVSVWSEQRESLQDTESLREFNERLAREWAIETGILEGLYTLDRGITSLLIEQGIDESLISHDATDGLPGKVAAHIRDQKEAVDWLFQFVTSERMFSESFIKELHALITRSQETATGINTFSQRVEVPLRRGEYKQWSNNPTRADGSVHIYCPPEQVTVQMERLIDYHDRYVAERVAPEVLSAWIHHRFTQIHPFQDGNGRVARALASLVFLREGWFPLVVHRDQRGDYIDALEAADRGNLAPLTDIFAATQRKAFVNALGIAREVLRAGEHLDQIVAAIGDHFQNRDRALSRNMVQAKEHAAALWTQAGDKFARTSQQLGEAIRGPRRRTVFDDYSHPDETGYRQRWHRAQIIRAANDLGYYANIGDFSAWRRLVLETETGRSEIVLSFHGIGREYRGIVGVSLCFFRKPETDEGHSMIEDHHTVSKELFQINYLESLEAAQARFSTWLDTCLLQALDLWRRGE